MRVKKLISFYEILHFFSILFVHNLLSRWLKECFSFFGFLCLLCKDSGKLVHFGSFWFILVHFSKSLFLFFFVAYRAASILALASSTSELLRELKGVAPSLYNLIYPIFRRHDALILHLISRKERGRELCIGTLRIPLHFKQGKLIITLLQIINLLLLTGTPKNPSFFRMQR